MVAEGLEKNESSQKINADFRSFLYVQVYHSNKKIKELILIDNSLIVYLIHYKLISYFDIIMLPSSIFESFSLLTKYNNAV